MGLLWLYGYSLKGLLVQKQEHYFFFFSFLAIDYKGNFNFKKLKQWAEEVFIHYMGGSDNGNQKGR